MFSFIYLLLLLVAALFFGKVAERFHQPTIVGNILGGLVFGPVFILLLGGFDNLFDVEIFQEVIDNLR
ncbi:MAG: hypothetical protein ACMUIG_04560, partial [Thermoplasmatota archaeon]